MPSVLAIYTENGPFINFSCGVAPPAFASLGVHSAFLTAAAASSCLATSLCSDDARITFRSFPSGATFALTHTDLLADEADDAARLAAVHEALVLALGADALADAARFDRAAFRRCADLVRLYIDCDDNSDIQNSSSSSSGGGVVGQGGAIAERRSIWQTTLGAECLIPPLPLLTAARAALADAVAQFPAAALEHVALLHGDQVFTASPPWCVCQQSILGAIGWHIWWSDHLFRGFV